jgi:GTP-binding protein Era
MHDLETFWFPRGVLYLISINIIKVPLKFEWDYQMTTRCGYIALLGRPNAGKSTLLNAFIGDKLAVVSRKPQTTRNRILGIADHRGAQMLFLDTPGIHQGQKHLINSAMNRVAYGAATEGDVLLYLVDAERGFTEEDQVFLSRTLSLTSAPCMVVLSRIDAIKQLEVSRQMRAMEIVLADFLAVPEHEAYKSRFVAMTPWLLSAKRPESVRALKDELVKFLPESPWLFPEDDLTDMPRSFLCGELVREQIFRQIGQEIPYGCAVKIEGIEFKPHIVVVQATIVISRAAHKPIILGKGGGRIKAIGEASRASLEQHFDQKVFLELNVRVTEGWHNDQKLMAELANLRDLDNLPKFAEPSTESSAEHDQSETLG